MKMRIVAVLVASLVLVALEPAQQAAAVDTPLVVSTQVIDFGSVIVGATSKQVPVQVTNTGSTSFGPINIFGGAPPSPDFNASQTCQGATLAAGASCQVTYTFKPTSFGPSQDASAFTISQTANQSDGESFTVVLKGRGISPLAMSTTGLDFGDVAVGSSAQRSVQVTNIAPTSVGPIALGDGEPPSAAFAVSLAGCQGKTLAPGASCPLTYTFAPRSAGRAVDSSTLVVSATSNIGKGATFAIGMTGCAPLCGPLVRHERHVTLALRGHLTAQGKVTTRDHVTACEAGVPVLIQRRHGRKWKTVDTSTTDAKGRFKQTVAGKAGSYRATVEPQSLAAGAEVCVASSSAARRAP